MHGERGRLRAQRLEEFRLDSDHRARGACEQIEVRVRAHEAVVTRIFELHAVETGDAGQRQPSRLMPERAEGVHRQRGGGERCAELGGFARTVGEFAACATAKVGFEVDGCHAIDEVVGPVLEITRGHVEESGVSPDAAQSVGSRALGAQSEVRFHLRDATPRSIASKEGEPRLR